MAATTNIIGTTGATVLEQLLREQKRQARSAPNKAATTAGALDDAVHVAVLADGTDLVGYLPPITTP
jgi:hypothetical protein